MFIAGFYIYKAIYFMLEILLIISHVFIKKKIILLHLHPVGILIKTKYCFGVKQSNSIPIIMVFSFLPN